jgi:toxin ParE1/3/4
MESVMLALKWKERARSDLLTILNYISDDNHEAAQQLKSAIQAKIEQLLEHPKLYRPGRVKNTREMVVRSNYVVIYTEDAHAITILRILHATQQWPSKPYTSKFGC